MINVKDIGLDGVIVSSSKISFIDGEQGELIYRGYNIHELAGKASFLETAWLLWYGDLPTKNQLEGLVKDIKKESKLPLQVYGSLCLYPSMEFPLTALRTGVSKLGFFDPDCEDRSEEACLRKAKRLTAQIAVILATTCRLQYGLDPIPPDTHLDFVGNFLHMLRSDIPTPSDIKAFDTCLMLHAEHDMNASTFVCRAVASTEATMHAAVTGGIAALSGRLHGGANQRVMVMLEEIGDPKKAKDYVKDKLVKKEKVMGFGHRVYKTQDPRAFHLKKMSETLCAEKGKSHLFEISKIIEDTMIEEKGIDANVDFYSATVLHCLGIPTSYFTSIFAAARIVGWTAHIMEQYANNRIMRPRADYIGTKGRKYVPINQR